MSIFENRLKALIGKLSERDIDVALITDDDSVYYYTGYYDYLHMEFGRPSILVVTSDGNSLLITPSMEMDMAEAAARVDRIAAWNDGMGNEWREELPALVSGKGVVALEPDLMPPLVRNYVNSLVDADRQIDIVPVISDMRMIKSEEELNLARHAGQVAMAMMAGGRSAIAAGVPEFEVALATSQAGTRKAAKLLSAHYDDHRMSPNTHFLQIMASGRDITMPHHRASTRAMQKGEPVFLCFCGMTNFHRFKLGFDRTFWIEEIAEKSQAAVYQVAVDSQKAALEVLRPGVAAEDVHKAMLKLFRALAMSIPSVAVVRPASLFLRNLSWFLVIKPSFSPAWC